jgi:hypothetical protein
VSLITVQTSTKDVLGRPKAGSMSEKQSRVDDNFIWQVRAFIYEHFVKTTCAPRVTDIAENLGLTTEQATQVLLALHEKHAIFLEPGTVNIRIANPFSAIPTPFRVDIHGQTYVANCAWDCFGIVAALHASEASIYSTCAHSGADLHLRVTQDSVSSNGEVVHFLVPFQNWYDDLVFT